ncbi:MAG TPA: glycosyltransferase family 2 protein [Chloroflexota bacterium]|nr:glycosyltransferase family 2 protein [Chloroflexota bacterium]
MATAIDERLVAQRIMSPTPRITVVVPAMNEARNLPYVLPKIPAWVSEVILVDGHSTDDTIAVARALRPTIRVIPQEGRGKGAALRTGFAAATGDIIVMLDADGSADAEEIERFVDALLNGADFAKGTRYMQGGGSADITGFRSLGNRALGGLVNLLFHARYTDLCYGYNAFWTHCLPYMQVDCDGFEVETQINIRVIKAGLQVAEVPSFEGKRIHGASNLNAFRDGWRVLAMIMREWRPTRRRQAPIMETQNWETLPANIRDIRFGAKSR